MSTSFYVEAIKPPDEAWLKHKQVWDACKAAGVEIPLATAEFFDYEPPDPNGVTVLLGWIGGSLKAEHCCTNEIDDRYGIIVDVAALPPGTTHIRVAC